MSPNDKKIQELLKGYFSVEEPSFDFTNLVMERIAKIEVEVEMPFTYTPVISKLGWGVILTLFVSAMFAVFVLGQKVESTTRLSDYIPQLNIDFSLFQSPVVALSLGSMLLLLIGERLVQHVKT